MVCLTDKDNFIERMYAFNQKEGNGKSLMYVQMYFAFLLKIRDNDSYKYQTIHTSTKRFIQVPNNSYKYQTIPMQLNLRCSILKYF
jgi:hypothetical protein